MGSHQALFHGQSYINCVTSGSTCILAYMNQNKLYIANVGDSRAVLGRREIVAASDAVVEEGKEEEERVIAINLSHDHKPDNPLEKDRIIKAGGYIKPARFGQSARVYLNPELTMIGIATSRTIGMFFNPFFLLLYYTIIIVMMIKHNR